MLDGWFERRDERESAVKQKYGRRQDLTGLLIALSA